MNPDGGMNSNLERQLKITVERVVRPVKTWDVRKQVIREELLGHLTAIYREEFERSGDEAGALHAARSRFGAPEELTRELQNGVPRIPRWVEVLNNFFRIDVKGSSRGNALKWTSFWAAELFVLFAACEVAAVCKGLSPWPMLLVLLTPLVMMTLIAYVALEGAFGAVLNGPEDMSYWRTVRQTCWKLGALGFAYKVVLAAQIVPLWERFGVQEAGIVVLSTVMLPAVFLLVMWGGRKEFRSQVAWARLDLEC